MIGNELHNIVFFCRTDFAKGLFYFIVPCSLGSLLTCSSLCCFSYFGTTRPPGFPCCFWGSLCNACSSGFCYSCFCCPWTTWRSEERRVGKECVSTCTSTCSPHH